MAPAPTTTTDDLAGARLECEAPVAPGPRGGERCIEANVDAVATMLGLDQCRGLLVAHPREDARRDLDDGNADAELAGGSGDLEADQASADHREMPRGLELRGERVAVSFGAQIVDAWRAERQHRQLAHRRPGGDDERVIGQAPARRRDHRADGAIDRDAARMKHQCDAVAGDTFRPGDRRVDRARLAEQHCLG
jgi:hypothetical protein